MKNLSFGVLSFVLIQSTLYAQSKSFIGFEDAESFGGDDAALSQSYFQNKGFTFSAVAGRSQSTATDVSFFFEKTGRDGTDFWNSNAGHDTAVMGDLGNYFLKAGNSKIDYRNSKYFKMSIDYTNPTLSAGAEIWDIDGPEQYDVTAFDVDGNVIGSLTSPRGGLSGSPWYWSFDALSEDAKIAKVEIEAIGNGVLRDFSMDNFDMVTPHPAPLPAAFPLGIACMSLLVYSKRRRAKQAAQSAV